MPAAEFAFWQDFRQQYGFPVDRLEAAIANAGGYVGGTMGGKLAASDLVFKPRRQMPRAFIEAYFESLTPDRFPGPAGVTR